MFTVTVASDQFYNADPLDLMKSSEGFPEEQSGG